MHRPLYRIAQEIDHNWRPMSIHARPYHRAMGDLDQISDNYGADSGSSVVAYFLSNASSWRGEVARRVKKELNEMLKEYHKEKGR